MLKKKIKTWFLLIFLLQFAFIGTALSQGSKSGLFINVGSANLKKSLIALPPFQYLGSSKGRSQLKVGKELFNTVFNDLSVSSYFRFIPQEAFLEDTAKTALRPKGSTTNGFDFAKWRPLGTEFLIRAGYKVVGGKLSVEAYLYYIPKSQTVFAKTYEGKAKDVRAIAHRFCDEIVERLTGKKGIFSSKIVVGRTTRRGEKEIFVMDWDGQNQTQVTNHRSIAFSPNWSPDGKSVVYSAFAYHKKSRTRNADLFRYDLKTAKRWLLSYRKGINSGAVFFPNMDNLLLRISRKGVSDIFRMTQDGKRISAITNGPRGAMNVEPDISPDGKQVVFSSDRSGKPMLYIMNSSGSNVRRLTYAGRYNSTPIFSPDGKKIAFAGHDKGKFDIFMMDSNGTNMVRLTSARKKDGTWSDNEGPTFSPDGRHIMFASNRSGYYQLYIVNIDGTNERRITFDTNDYFAPKWSPNLR